MILPVIRKKLKTISAGILWISCCFSVASQNPIILEYQGKSGDYSGLYSGQIKREYNVNLYANHPYYKSIDFADARLVYDGNVFFGQKIRLDLYTEELIIRSPKSHFNIIANPEKADTIAAWGETIIHLNPPEKSGLSKGFYSLLFDGRQLQALFKTKFFYSEILTDKKVERVFNESTQYYLRFNGKYYPAKNKKSFIKLFPQYKMQINRFSKEHSLDFKKRAHRSFALLAEHCEELLQSGQKP